MIANTDPTAWLREMIAMESEGERSPARPPRAVRRVVSLDFASGAVDSPFDPFDPTMPAFLRRQAD